MKGMVNTFRVTATKLALCLMLGLVVIATMSSCKKNETDPEYTPPKESVGSVSYGG